MCVCVWEEKQQKYVQDEMNWVRPKINFLYNSDDNLISPLYGDLLRPHPWECQRFPAWLWKAGRDSRQSIMLHPIPWCPIKRGMLLQGAVVLPAGRYSYKMRLNAGSFHCLEEVLLISERNTDAVVILLQFHFKVTSCSALSNQEYCNNTLIKWHSKYMDHNSNIFQSPEDYHGYNLTKAICTNSCLR